MERVELPTENNTPGETTQFFDEVLEYTGDYIPASARVHGVGQDLAEAYLGFTKRVRAESALPQDLKERIAFVVSERNNSSSCMSTHAENLRRMGVSDDELDTLVSKHVLTETDDRTMAALAYAEQITERPNEITNEDVDQLKDYGYSDEEIIEIAVLSCYYNYINRLNFALYDRE